VPAASFERAIAQIQELGDLVSRNVQVVDVTDQFRDTRIRIATLRSMHARLEELLRSAPDVQSALAVEQQLERITVELEQLEGQLRGLEGRIAFSTITVRFAERTSNAEPDFALPFRWLNELGLRTLLSL
jgi:ABC-type uncharacterized transport system fused permease/ATPase subunit